MSGSAARPSWLPELGERGETPDVALAAARRYIRESRQTHIEWIGWLKAGHGTPDDIDTAGDLEHHRECVRRYDLVLVVLDFVDETLAVRMVDAIARISDEETRKQACRLARHALRYRKEAHAACQVPSPGLTP